MTILSGEPLRRIKVRMVSAESMGVRSMCVLVETPDVRILLDPSAALGKRYGLFPHPKEYRAVEKATREILKIAEKCDVLTISHYHWDHFKPFFENYTFIWSNEEIASALYEGKIVLAKDFRSNVNFSQRMRGYMFHKRVLEVAEKVEVADGRTFRIGDTRIMFSRPFWHGPPKTALGYVLICSVEREGEKFVHAPDVQGPMDGEATDFILGLRANLVYVGGPPLYLKGYRVGEKELEMALENMRKLDEAGTLVVDHHLLRDPGWRKWCKRKISKPMCAAEFEGKRAKLLEARRRELYEKYPPDEDFVKWTKLPPQKRRMTRPPI